ncbi:hypothetical protein AAF712_013101 [Marasmius tenuissimus]|uniref:Uncharacterized protein n=1 Tax=Marasmius tenuissimus TaxID=585030 RepID=A0ABR2ZGL7_9AGAR
MPGKWERKTYKPKYLPPLHHHSPDGTVTPLHFDNCHFNDLPRFTSTVHPLIVILFLKISSPDIYGAPPSIQENAITPLTEVCGSWPCWIHNRFVPLPTSSNRKRDDSAPIPCYCPLCSAEDSQSSNATLESDSSSALDLDVNLKSNPSDLCTTNDDLVVSWQRRLEKDAIHQLPDADGAVIEYAQETVPSPEDVPRRLKEEDDKRWILAKSTVNSHRAKWRR